MGDQIDPHMITFFQIVHDGSTVSDSRFYMDSRSHNTGSGTLGHFVYGPVSIDYVLPAWTGAKQTHVSFREYSPDYKCVLHEVYIFSDTNNSSQGVGADLAYPIETIMYSVM